MPGKVIPFPVAVRTASPEAIVARHHILIEVGDSRYEMEVMIFVTWLESPKADGGRRVRFLRTQAGTEGETGGRGSGGGIERLGIAGCSPGSAADKTAKNSLAMWPRQRDESSCATSADKEVHMTNVESDDTTVKDGVPDANTATTAAGAARKSRPGELAIKSQKRRPTKPRKGGRASHIKTKTGAKSAKTGATAAAIRPRPQSKGARILELIGRAKGATLAEIMHATKWQAHSVRGFLSTAAKKYRRKIQSLKNEAGQRVYQLKG
jgi:hypothetical protein